jgi:hypothetical protein
MSLKEELQLIISVCNKQEYRGQWNESIVVPV